MVSVVFQRSKRSLAAARPDLQPQARRKNLQESNVPLHPRIQNVGVNVKSVSQVRKEYGNVGTGDGGGDERISADELVTIRGALPPPGEWCNYSL